MFNNVLYKFQSLDSRLLGLVIFIGSFICHFGFLGLKYGSDEALFLLQARMLSDGIYPVIDYYSKDVPYFLLIYGYLMKFVGFNLISARIISYLFSSSIVVLLYAWVIQIYKRNDVALIGASLLVTSRLYFQEGSPLSSGGHTQTALLFLMLALVLSSFDFSRYFPLKVHALSVSIGFILGVAVWCRSPAIAPAAVIFIHYVYQLYKNDSRLNAVIVAVIWGVIGGIISSSFGIYLFISRPDTFIFSYIQSTFFMTGMGAYDQFGSYPDSPWMFRFNAFKEFLISFRGQTLSLLCLLVSSLFLVYKRHAYRPFLYPTILQFLIVFSYMFIYVFISRHGFTWHYFGVFTPFLIMASVPSTIYITQHLRSLRTLSIILSLLLLFHLYGGRGVVFTYTRFIAPPPIGFQTQASVQKVAHAISNLTKPQDLILVGGQAPLFVSGRYPPNSLINSSWLNQLFRVIGNGDYTRHHLISEAGLLDMIRLKKFTLIVDDPFLMSDLSSNISVAIQNHYRFLNSIDRDYTLFIPKE